MSLQAGADDDHHYTVVHVVRRTSGGALFGKCCGMMTLSVQVHCVR